MITQEQLQKLYLPNLNDYAGTATEALVDASRHGFSNMMLNK